MPHPLQTTFEPVSVCKICGGSAHYFDVVDLNKCCSLQDFYRFGLIGEPVYFLRCDACEFIFTEHCDGWTPDVFSDRIYNKDYIAVDGEYLGARPTRMAEQSAQLLSDGTDLSILDYGSGTGVFAQKMRSFGFSKIENFDPFSSPSRPTGLFDVITAFEVLEHTPTPLQSVQEMLSFAKPDCAILFTTMVQPEDISTVRGQHWYIAPRNGHVSIYSTSSICELAKHFGLSYRIYKTYHALVRGNPPLDIDSAPIQCIRLLAPPLGSSEFWNNIENPEVSPRRWTASSSIEWRLDNTAPTTVYLSIPYIAEIIPDFATRCVVSADDIPVTTTSIKTERGHELRARLNLYRSRPLIVLKTPELDSQI